MTRAEARVLRGQIRAMKCDCLSCRSVPTGQYLSVSVFRLRIAGVSSTMSSPSDCRFIVHLAVVRPFWLWFGHSG